MDLMNIQSQFTEVPSAHGAKRNSELGQNEFLQLLIAQMRHQDPINPLDGAEFASQLAQFNSVEQLIGVNQGLDALMKSQELMSSSLTNSMAASLTGHEVRALSNQVRLTAGEPVRVAYKLNSPATETEFVIRNASGGEVRRETVQGVNSGDNVWVWDGKNNSGDRMGEGEYTVEVRASNEGSNVGSLVFTEGVVDKVRFTGQGVYLTVNGIELPIGDVEEVRGKHL